MATRPREVEAPQWTYGQLKELYNAPENGNAGIYWMDAGFIQDLRPEGF